MHAPINVIDALKNWFSRFLRRRRALKHFGRHPLGDTLAGSGPAPALPEHLASDLMGIARGEMNPDLEKVAFSLPAGAISDPIPVGEVMTPIVIGK